MDPEIPTHIFQQAGEGPALRPGSWSLCGSPAESALPCCSEKPTAAAKEGRVLTTGDQVAKSPCGCIKAARKWRPIPWLQGLSLGDERCSICLCVHPTAPGPAITQLCLASEEGKCLGEQESPVLRHRHCPAPSYHCSQHPLSQLLNLFPLWSDFCTVLSINQLPPPELPRVHVIPAGASFERDVKTSLTCPNTEIPLPNTHFSRHWQS